MDTVKLSDETKESFPEPSNWDFYECILGLSKRIRSLETKINILIATAVINSIGLLILLLR